MRQSSYLVTPPQDMDMDLSHLSKYSPLLVLVLLSLGQIKLTEAAFCELIGPPGAGGPEFGLIFVPGAQVDYDK